MRVLVTGGCGFAGHHLVEHVLETTDHDVVVLDSLTYAGRVDRLLDVERYDPGRVEIVWHDLRAPLPSHPALNDVTSVVHLAAESHVDRSIADPRYVVMNNVAATVNLLEWARERHLRHFIQVSTDEVYGPAARGYAHPEWDTHLPSNPYSASKSAQEAVAISYWRTFNVPVIITNTMNMFGERQHPEKFVPLLISRLLRERPVTLHARRTTSGAWSPSSRHWLHARNHADAICWLLSYGPARYGEVGIDRPDRWHVAGEERTVLELAETVAALLDRELLIEWKDYHSLRPGHDHRYALDSSKIRSHGWKPPLSLEDSLERTVRWMIDHPRWLDPDENPVLR